MEINERFNAATKLLHATNNTSFTCKNDVSRKTRVTVFNTEYKAELTYGCESKVLSKGIKRKIQAVEMQYLPNNERDDRKGWEKNIDTREQPKTKSF